MAATADLIMLAAALGRDVDLQRLPALRRILELETDRAALVTPQARKMRTPRGRIPTQDGKHTTCSQDDAGSRDGVAAGTGGRRGGGHPSADPHARAAAVAVAGRVFSELLIVALVLVQLAIGTTPGDASVWLTHQPHREAVQAALGLISVVAIAFLWFVGVVRDHIGDREDRFFATPAWAFLVSLHILRRGHLSAPNAAQPSRSAPRCEKAAETARSTRPVSG